MCGRYSLFTPIQKIEVALGVKAVELANWQARYNATPSQNMPVITNEFPNIIQFFKWGLIPKWAKDGSIGHKMSNTRTESIEEKPSFKNIFKYKRCIVLADGYYEWQTNTTINNKGKQVITKQPYRIHLPNNEVMLIAGLWDTWNDGLQTFSIITCPPNQDVEHIHQRMPVILNQQEAKLWLSNTLSTNQLQLLLKPCDLGVLEEYAISNLVNKAINDSEDVIAPLIMPI